MDTKEIQPVEAPCGVKVFLLLPDRKHIQVKVMGGDVWVFQGEEGDPERNFLALTTPDARMMAAAVTAACDHIQNKEDDDDSL